jgi:hypothetical protein
LGLPNSGCPDGSFGHTVCVAHLFYGEIMATNKQVHSGSTYTTLAHLQFSNDAKPLKQPAIVQRRNKLITRIWEQIELLKSIENGGEFVVRRLKNVKDMGGIVKRVPMPKRIKPWWFTNNIGILCVTIRYGSATLEIYPGKPVIQAKNTKELLNILTLIKQAVADGELDQQIEKASGALKLNFQSNS